MLKLSYPVIVPDTNAPMMAWQDSFETVFPKLKAMGYEAVELLVRDPRTVDREYLLKQLEANGLVLSMIGTGPMQREEHLFLMEQDETKRAEALARLDALIDLGAFFHVPVIVAKYRGTCSDAPGCTMDDLAAILKTADEKTKAAGIELLIEPQNANNINNLNAIGETVDFIRGTGLRNTRLLMDIFHMDVTEESIPVSLEKYQEYLCALHLSDRARMIPGLGTLDYVKILRTLKKIGFDGYASVEVKQISDSEQTARLNAMALRYLENFC